MKSEFIGILHPGADILENLNYNLLNSTVAAVGIYAAAFTIDLAWLGRQRMQVCINACFARLHGLYAGCLAACVFHLGPSGISKTLLLSEQQAARA